jgi:hypothetical protein
VNTLKSLERTERPVRGSVTDDATREDGTDPRQGFDLARTRHVQINHRRRSSCICSDGVRFAGDDAEWLAHPAFRRVGSSPGIRCGARSRASSTRASVRRSSSRFRRAARAGVSAARRVDGRYLSRERQAVRGLGRTATSRGPHDTHARAKHDDTGEEQQRFAFGGGWHGAKIASPTRN